MVLTEKGRCPRGGFHGRRGREALHVSPLCGRSPGAWVQLQASASYPQLVRLPACLGSVLFWSWAVFCSEHCLQLIVTVGVHGCCLFSVQARQDLGAPGELRT